MPDLNLNDQFTNFETLGILIILYSVEIKFRKPSNSKLKNFIYTNHGAIDNL